MLDAIAGFALDFVVDLVLYVLFYWPGWLILRIFTLGKYPPQSQPHNRLFVSGIPLVTLLVIITFYLS